jgi:hypothetical protein
MRKRKTGIFQRTGILQQLPVRGLQVLVLALVFPGEAGAPPDIGPAIAAAGLVASFSNA